MIDTLMRSLKSSNRKAEMTTAQKKAQPKRRHFIGRSDARIIMSQNEQALIRHWQEKRGEVGPEELSGDLIAECEAFRDAYHGQATQMGFAGQAFFRFRNRTPAPPPFSSMNSMPAASIAFSSLVRASSETCGPNPPSKRLTVGTDRPALKASSL
jgi:hypothetical protein